MNKTGERLSHLLDLIGFKVGRGRIPEFQTYLNNKQIPELSSLKYSTVRSWFSNHAPPMKKVNKIIDALNEDFDFYCDLQQIKVWWKLGGISPFPVTVNTNSTNFNSSEDKRYKLNFLITSMVKDESGESFDTISSNSLIAVKEKAIKLALEFADQYKKEVPHDYLRIFIADELRKNII